MMPILLTRGQRALVDNEVYKWLRGYNWSVLQRERGGARMYARRCAMGQIVYLHRLVAGVPGLLWVGFRDGNGLDCRRGNIYAVDMNGRELACQGSMDGQSEYRGVVWDGDAGIWRAEVQGLTIGYYGAEADAARAYNAKMLDLYPAREDMELNQIPYLSDSLARCMPERGEGRPNRDGRRRGYHETENGRYDVDAQVDGHRMHRRVRLRDGEPANEERAAELAEQVYREADAAERIAG